MGEIICGDCLEEMEKLEPKSIDSVVTDPPYSYKGGFMGKNWDSFESPKEYQEFCQKWGEKCLDVLKPGAHLLAFSGTHSFHRLATGLEDAGFEIKTTLMWVFGSGFPKSLDISKAIDEHFGKEDERRITEVKEGSWGEEQADQSWGMVGGERTFSEAATEEAKKWSGWGTALKPAYEPIVLAQKPRNGTYAENVLKYGVGGLNIDACRIPHNEPIKKTDRKKNQGQTWNDENTGLRDNPTNLASPSQKGRWPANVVLDPVSSKLLDEQSGISRSGKPKQERDKIDDKNLYGNSRVSGLGGYSDKGGASRFFYCAKAHKSERNAGLEDLEEKEQDVGELGINEPKSREKRGRNPQKTRVKNDISTLKPINLCRWLVRLITPEDGVVLDPFSGSGTTGCACEIEGFDYILIEKRERFANLIAPKRIEYWSKEENWSELKEHKELRDPEKKEIKKLDEFT